MLYAGLDLSRKRLDVCLLDEQGARVAVTAAPPDADGLRGLAERLAGHGEPIYAALESMNGARFVRDELAQLGWEVALADAQKVKGLAPLAAKTDRIDAYVLAELARRDLVPAIWLPSPAVRAERARASASTSCVTAPPSRRASTRASSPTVTPARWPTSSARGDAPCSTRWRCPRPGGRAPPPDCT